MRWSIAVLVGVTVSVAVLLTFGGEPAGVLVATLGCVFLIARLTPCRHAGPLGLLPPVTNPDGTRTQAQWYCDSCGRNWPANFDHESRVVQRFEGHDESKAAASARRAEELTKRRRALAVRRAGIETPVRPRLAHDAAQVVPMTRVRRFAK